MKVNTEWTSTDGLGGSSTFEIPSCPHKLPCGWCERLDRQCPKAIPFIPTVTFDIGDVHPPTWEVTCEDKK